MNTTDYIGNFAYTDAELEFIHTAEGRVVPDIYNTGEFEYQYYLKDHLGNNRVLFNENGDVLQSNSYYPFGMQMSSMFEDPNSGGLLNKYLYNGKEMQDDFGLDWYDYGARFYDSQLGRWHVVDNLSEKYNDCSPFNYALNNPINAIDPDGSLVLFVNGFRVNQYIAEQAFRPSKWTRKSNRISQNDMHNYWGTFNNKYMDRTLDKNAYYVDGMGDGPLSMAKSRYNSGKRSARKIHRGIKKDKIGFGDNETIKIAGHSHGAAHAAGMADFFSKKGYDVERYDAIVPHQPNQIELKEADNIVSANQYSRESDKVSSTGGKNILFGNSQLEKIEGIKNSNYFILKNVDGGQGGHYIETFIQELFDLVPEGQDVKFVIPQRLPEATIK